MKNLTALLAAATLAFSLAGCTAYKHNRAGDAAAATGDMRSAVYHYERALANKERYARDADFLNKLAVARARVAYDDATKLRAEGRYEPAIQKLHESMQQDPAYPEPKELLPTLKKEAGQWRHTRAVASADAGDLTAARQHLQHAMQHDLTNEAAAYALASLSPELMAADTPGLEDYQQGVSLSGQRRWLKAEAALMDAIANNGGLLPARAALHDARAQLAQARQLERDGRAEIDTLNIGPAMDALTRSLAVWPDNPDAQTLLATAKAQRALADTQFTQATAAANQANWDNAIALADSGLDIDRSHPALGELRSALPRRAATDHTQRADAHFAENELDKAHASYSRALSYRSTHRDARQGISDVYAAWGTGHEQAGRSGAALLNYQRAQGYSNNKTLIEGIVRTKAAVRDRLGMGLSVSAKEQRRGEIDPRKLGSALAGELLGSQAQGLAVNGEGMPYEVKLTISRATIDEQRTNTAQRSHHYTTQEWRHNAEYDRIAKKVHHAQRDYDRACRNYRNAAGHGHATHHHQHDAAYGHHYSKINSTKSRLDKLRHQLSCTPKQIKVTLHHDWPYTVETYTKTGELHVLTELIDTSTGKAVQRFTHEASFKQSDDRTLNANPSVGVRVDDLRLKSDSTVRNTLTTELACAAGPWALNAAVDHKLASLAAAIDTYESKGNTAAALEARVDSALLLEFVDQNGSRTAVNKLVESQTK